MLISGCVNIKSKYIQPNIYTIQHHPLNDVIKIKIDKSIFIKEFDVGGELATNKIVVYDRNNLYYHNYHLWVLPLDELLTNYISNRFTSYNSFAKGVWTSIFSTSPDYILECKINALQITNSNEENSVEIILTAYLHKYSTDSKDYQICFSNNYSKKENSNDFKLEKMIMIVGNIMSEIIDNILKDIIANL